MSFSAQSCTWSLDVFVQCYNAIKLDTPLIDAPFAQIKEDLKNVLTVPGRNENSRKALLEGESGKSILLPNDEEIAFNAAFVASTSTLAFELDLDELHASECMQHALETTFLKGSDPIEAGMLFFFQRYQYILNILGFLVTENKLTAVLGADAYGQLLPQILGSFKKIYALLAMQNSLIDKQRATADINELLFVNKTTYAKRQLFDLHDVLAQVLCSLIDSDPAKLSTFCTYNTLVAHIDDCIKSDDDIFILHYLPSLSRITTLLDRQTDEEVRKIHSTFSAELKSDHSKVHSDDGLDLAKSGMRGYRRVIQLMFFICLIPWCKQTAERAGQYDFEEDILKQVEWLIGYGTLEQLLCYTAEFMHPETCSVLENGRLLDFRLLLQRNHPAMAPTQLIPAGAEEFMHTAKGQTQKLNVARLFDVRCFRPSETMCDALLAPQFHLFFCNFINHAAIVLTQLRDSEEDFLLLSINRKETEFAAKGDYHEDENHLYNSSKSGSRSDETRQCSSYQIDLSELASCAELERFYMACVYTYSHRQELCDEFWKLDNQNVLGFITWGLANNTSPLITSTFCLLLGSLTYGHSGSSVKVWELLVNTQDGVFKKNDYSKISIDSILSSLNYYVGALSDSLESELASYLRQQQEKQEHLYSSETRGSNPVPVTVQLSEDSVAFISGFFLLLLALVENTDTSDSRCAQMRVAAFTKVQSTVEAYLRFDSLVVTASTLLRNRKDRPPFFDDDNRTVLLNLVLNLLSGFAKHGGLKLNGEIWICVDKWLCHSLLSGTGGTQVSEPSRYTGVALPVSTGTNIKSALLKFKASNAGMPMKQSFELAFTNVLQIANFVRLMERLLDAKFFSDSSSTESTSDDTIADADHGDFVRPVLPYPTNLGQGYRYKNQTGVWPYIEFLIGEVFSKSADLAAQSKEAIQNSILGMVNSALSAIDWNLYEEVGPRVFPHSVPTNSFAVAIDASGTEAPISYCTFVRLHHSLAVLNYLFDINACRTLFEAIGLGDTINDDEQLAELVARAVSCIDLILSVQKVFVCKLLPLLQNRDTALARMTPATGYGTSMSMSLFIKSTENIYYPSDLGTKGLSDFDDIMLINAPSVVLIALYVGSYSSKISTPALRVVAQLAKAPVFNGLCHVANDTLLEDNRLLAIFEHTDESSRVIYAFVQQLESERGSLSTKLDILSFLHRTLFRARKKTVAHFLLGFEQLDGTLVIGPESGLLHVLILLLVTLVDLSFKYLVRFQQTVEYGPNALSSAVLKVLLELCRNPITSAASLTYLRSFDLVEVFLNAQARTDETTLWETQRFNGNMQENIINLFVNDDKARKAFSAYIESQNLILQYLTLEFHSATSQTRREHYIQLLVQGTAFFNGTPKILDALDIFNFLVYNVEEYGFRQAEHDCNLSELVQQMCADNFECDSYESVLSRLDTYIFQTVRSTTSSSTNQSIVVANGTENTSYMRTVLPRVIFALQTHFLQSRCLHSWSQLIQVLTKEELDDKAAMVLQVLQTVLPKINVDYYERDMLFAEELMSLCLFLCDTYEQAAKSSADSKRHGLHRLMPLFNTCVAGLMAFNSTVSLRCDIYLLLHKFLLVGLKNAPIRKQIGLRLLAAGERLVDVMANDCVHSEGILRVTAVVCFESLVHLLNEEHACGILQTLVKHNYLSLLTRLLKRADEIISASEGNGKVNHTKNQSYIYNPQGQIRQKGKNQDHTAQYQRSQNEQKTHLGMPSNGQQVEIRPSEDNDYTRQTTRNRQAVQMDSGAPENKINVDTLLYELTALKATLYLLIRIGQTKAGASQLIQNEIFPIIRRLQFLSVDVDLGMEFQIDADGTNNATIQLSLDVPITIKYGQIRSIAGSDSHKNKGQNEPGWKKDLGFSKEGQGSEDGKNVSYYELLVPVFQLVATVLLSVGPSYKPAVGQAQQLLQQYRPLVQAIMKRDTITLKVKELAVGPGTSHGDCMDDGLSQMAKLFTLIHSIVFPE